MQNKNILEIAEKNQSSYKRATTTYRSYADVINKKQDQLLNPKPSAYDVSYIAEQTAKKITLGILLNPELLNLEKLPLTDRINKLCELVEKLNIRINRNEVNQVVKMNKILSQK